MHISFGLRLLKTSSARYSEHFWVVKIKNLKNLKDFTLFTNKREILKLN